MWNASSAMVFRPALLASAAVLCGCTAGEIVAADGSALTGYGGPSTVTFTNTSTYEQYTVSPSQGSGGLAFSFDPYSPANATNGPYIPPGNYKLDVTLCSDATHCQPYDNWHGLDLAYNQTCTDYYTGHSVQCAIFKVVRCNFPADYNKYGSAWCTGSSTSGGVTTVGVLDGP